MGSTQPISQVRSQEVNLPHARQRLVYSPLQSPSHTKGVLPTCRPSALPPRGSTLRQLLSSIEVPHTLVAGRLQLFLPIWERITSNPWVLNTVSGFRIPITGTPYQTCHVQLPTPGDPQLVDRSLSDLFQKGVIAPNSLPHSHTTFVSPIFLVPKKNGEHRVILNLRSLNQFVPHHHFKMEGAHLLKDMLQQGDWLTKIDLKEAYYALPIHLGSQYLLSFMWNEKLFHFTCLPFGLSCAPRVFTKMLKPVVALLRGRGVRLIAYIDDILIMSSSKAMSHHHTLLALDCLESLGFLVNYPKCSLTPSQSILFLGFTVNSIAMTLSLPEEKITTIQKEAHSMLTKPTVSARSIARLVGLMSASIPAVLPAPLHYRALQRAKNLAVARGGYNCTVYLKEAERQELVWWMKMIKDANGRAIKPRLPDKVIYTDASRLGWGAVHNQHQIGGLWTDAETNLHINCLELLAAWYAVQAFTLMKRDLHILLWIDNQSAVAYINHKGGNHSTQLAQLAIQFWSWALQKGITLEARHIAGKKNVQADRMSRTIQDRSDWKLRTALFHQLNILWGPLEIDLFATRISTQLPRFFSWKPEPLAEAIDAFLQDWSTVRGYANPPWCLLTRCLR